jgi:hypothetical protein
LEVVINCLILLVMDPVHLVSSVLRVSERSEGELLLFVVIVIIMYTYILYFPLRLWCSLAALHLQDLIKMMKIVVVVSRLILQPGIVHLDRANVERFLPTNTRFVVQLKMQTVRRPKSLLAVKISVIMKVIVHPVLLVKMVNL